MTVVIGLTGSIASGKSTVSLMFDEFNIPVVDADKLSRKVVEPGKKAYNDIVEEFGHDILRDDQTIDRKALGTIVFNDEEKRKKLNSFVHPAVREEMLQERDYYVAEGFKAVVLDIPLLFESDLAHFVDKVVVVYVDEETQLKRLMERDDSSREESLSRINSQMPVSEKANKADEVVDNSGSKYESYKQLEAILHRWEII
ncbi:dephospho-CoA kinase [Pontibacillus yanchengensis]|uniref:Dephospho-CoA kinase n=2 Tax=Pontibacillus yanchengensis TaxID=462910 RepID=A0ACC7VCU8_9BACI|nr:dephospho-CoA kinase [Pontibacillus yanchengensis]MYL34155.1 dephospho-CoA kinase [Pontibacillus yanchengensis]MYL53248.1 dephospho-CoA kinase [Pontibacillus yanchengensis]